MCLAIKRFALDEGRERLAIDARVAPFSPLKYEQVGLFLGPPLSEQMMFGAEDPLTCHMSLRTGGGDRACQVFVVVHDQPIEPHSLHLRGWMQTLDLVRSIPGLIGAYPEPGILDRLLFGFGGRADEQGFKYSRLLQLWRLEQNELALVGSDRQRLTAAAATAHLVPTERPAAMHLHVADLATTQLRGLVNWLFYRRAWQTSLANVQLVNHVARQFRLPPQEAWSIAESLVDARFVCSLGGEYRALLDHSGWSSTAWPDPQFADVPADYEAPLLQWFRGLDAEVVQAERQFVVHAILDVERIEADNSQSLPGFESFPGFDPIESLKGFFKSDEADSKQPDLSDSK
jgi:hypothetical protein